VPTSYLLDTNVVSEARRARPDRAVLAFLESLEESPVFISVLTLGELRKGVVARLQRDAAAGANLAKWVDETETDFAERILPVDRAIARRWGELSASRPLPVIDALIATTALVHGLTLVTRNVRDMAIGGVELLNPWTAD
jgi:predicted nucleic acid-binding protein